MAVSSTRPPQRNIAQRVPGGFGVEFGGSLVDDRAGDMTAYLAHPLRHVVDFLHGVAVAIAAFGAGDEDDLGFQAAGDLGVQAGREGVDGVGVHALDHQHIGPFGGAHAQADHIFEQFRFLTGCQPVIRLDYRDGGGGLDQTDFASKVDRVFVGRILLRDRLGEADPVALPLQGADDAEGHRGQTDILTGRNKVEYLHGID